MLYVDDVAIGGVKNSRVGGQFRFLELNIARHRKYSLVPEDTRPGVLLFWAYNDFPSGVH